MHYYEKKKVICEESTISNVKPLLVKREAT